MLKTVWLGILGCSALLSCKVRQEGGFDLKGARIDQIAKEVDYPKLFNQPPEWKKADTSRAVLNKPLVWTVMFAYANAHQPSFDQKGNFALATNDQATHAAYNVIQWLVKQHRQEGKSLLSATPVPTVVATLPGRPLPLPRQGTILDPTKLYAYRATLPKTRVAFDDHGKTVSKEVDIDLRIYVGRNVDPQRGNEMPEEHREALAQAFVSSDVLVYNGHIWSMDTTFRRFNPGVDRQIPADRNTELLARRIEELGGRKTYGVFFINACHGETIERYLMRSLIGKNTDRSNDPLLLSHRNYSNYGLFSSHNTTLIEDVINGQALAKIIYDLTPMGQLKASGPLQKPGQPGDAVRQLSRYYENNPIETNQHAVVIVAYDYTLAQSGSGRTR